ncbi:hypothetical protein D3C72_1543360 [compost metagenome]
MIFFLFHDHFYHFGIGCIFHSIIYKIDNHLIYPVLVCVYFCIQITFDNQFVFSINSDVVTAGIQHFRNGEPIFGKFQLTSSYTMDIQKIIHQLVKFFQTIRRLIDQSRNHLMCWLIFQSLQKLKRSFETRDWCF